MKCLIYAKLENSTWVNDCFNKINPYLIQVVNKPLLEYFIDFCSTLGIADIRIVSNNSTDKIHQYFTDGKKWGVDISYNIAKPEDSIKNIILKNYSFCKNEDVLIFNDFFFLEYDINKLQNQKAEILEKLKEVKGYYLQFLSKSGSYKKLNTVKSNETVKLPTASCGVRVLESVMDYFSLSMEILKDKSNQYVLPGYSIEPHTFMGKNVSYPKSVSVTPPIMIGDNVNLGEMVEIEQNTIIGNNIIIDTLTNIENSIIYSDSFIGTDLEIKNKIVYRNKLISAETGETLVMDDDDYLISGINKEYHISKFEMLIQYMMALGLILVQTVPFIIFAPFILLVSFKHNFKRKYFINSDQKSRAFFSLDSHRELFLVKLLMKFSLDKYPYLFGVLTGKISLIGNKLLTQTNQHSYLIKTLPVYSPGVFSYAESLNLYESENEEIHELYYITNQTFWKNIRILVKTIILRIFR